MNRLRWIFQRLLQLIPVLIGITFVSFMLVQLTPGDPARLMLGNKASPEAVEAVRERLGLNQPKVKQYFSYMGRLAQGDLGESIRYRVPVSGLITDVLPVSGFLALYVIILTIPATLILGVTAARRQGSWLDQTIRVFSVLGMTMPVFWLAILMLRLFSVQLGLFPVSGYGVGFSGHLHHLFLPAFSISIYLIPVLLRNLRAAILEEMEADYVVASRAKGLPEAYIFRSHILKNASLPTLNLFGVMVTYLIGGTVIVELVYAIPGLGTLMFNAILGRDYSVIQGLTLFYAFATVMITLFTDLISSLIDPRVEL
ncbi:MAG: ABC-type dipeptide/oligopeptide/nickel transport system permease component [Rhodothermales bacterium]